jgi:hypothetical protein
MKKGIRQRLLNVMVKTLGFFVLVSFLLGCGKKADPLPLYKQPLFSNNLKEEAQPTTKNQDSHKIENQDTGEKTP